MSSYQNIIENQSFPVSAKPSTNGTLGEPATRKTDPGMWYYFQLDAKECKVSENLRLGNHAIVVVADRAYSGEESIDDEVAGVMHVQRLARSESKRSLLKVTVGEDCEEPGSYWFEYRFRHLADGYWLKWVPQNSLGSKTLEDDGFPVITPRQGLWWNDLCAELWGLFLLLFFVVGIWSVIQETIFGSN